VRESGCPYRDGRRGRTFKGRPGVGGTTTEAGLACSRCRKTSWRPVAGHATTNAIDKKFTAAGWKLDPHVCVDCQRVAKLEKEKPAMDDAQSPAAIKATIDMVELIREHFDADKGIYAAGWDDAAISRKVGLPPERVKKFRISGFGEIKTPPEYQSIRQDLKTLETLESERHASIVQEFSALRARLAKAESKFAA